MAKKAKHMPPMKRSASAAPLATKMRGAHAGSMKGGTGKNKGRVRQAGVGTGGRQDAVD